MPNPKAEEPKSKNNYEIEKFVYRGGQLVSFNLKGKGIVAIQDVIAYLSDGSTCSCQIDGKNKKIIVRNSGSGDYVTFEGETKALEQLIPVTVTKKVNKDKDGKEISKEYEPNPMIHNA